MLIESDVIKETREVAIIELTHRMADLSLRPMTAKSKAELAGLALQVQHITGQPVH
jgi:hypothetical protein